MRPKCLSLSIGYNLSCWVFPSILQGSKPCWIIMWRPHCWDNILVGCSPQHQSGNDTHLPSVSLYGTAGKLQGARPPQAGKGCHHSSPNGGESFSLLHFLAKWPSYPQVNQAPLPPFLEGWITSFRAAARAAS
jgi:hypothetical protein